MKTQSTQDNAEATNNVQEQQIVKAIFLDHGSAFEIDSGSISMSFNLDTTNGRQTLFSKDASGNGDGGHIVAFVDYGRINMRIQDENSETWIKTDQILSAATDHTFEVKFGPNGVDLYVDDILRAESDFSFSLSNNTEVLKLGANGWVSKVHAPYSASHFMEGTISEFSLTDENGNSAYTLAAPVTLDGAADSVIIPFQTPIQPPSPPVMNEPETIKALLIEHSDTLAVGYGAISMNFQLDSIDGRQTLFSKDALGNGDGGHIVAFSQNGRINIRLQDDKGETWIKTDQILAAGEEHQLSVQFDNNGVSLFVDGVEQGHANFSFSLANNQEVLQLGSNGWASKAHTPFLAQDFMEGTINAFSLTEAGTGQAVYSLESPLTLSKDADIKIIEASDDSTGGGDDNGEDPITPPQIPTPPTAPSEKAYVGALKNFILTDFNNGALPENGAGAGYPSVYGEGGSTGTLSLTSEDAIMGDALKYEVDTGYIYLQFNAHHSVGRGYAREFAEDQTQTWEFDTYNRMRLWVKLPDTDEMDGISSNGAFTGDTNVGTYIKNTTTNDPYSDETGGGHPYHHVGAAANGEWTQIVLNWHPSHMRGADGAKDHGAMQYATGEEGINYFDALTRFYITARANSDDHAFSGPVEVMVDEIEFFQTPYKENDEQVYSVASNFDGDTVTISWNRHKDEGHIKHEVRYSFDNIHETGWENATAAPGGLISPPNGGAYNGMYYSTDSLPLTGQNLVYIAIKPENSDLFTQITVPLDPDGDGETNYSDYLIAHREGELYENPDDIVGTDGNDTLSGTSSDDVMRGLAGNDTLKGDAGADVVFTGAGENYANGGEGADIIVGGSQKDVLNGDAGDDQVFGQAGNDILVGNDGDDTIVGNEGNDVLVGWTGSDVLFGGSGNDSLDGGAGSDILTGGTGSDEFSFSIGIDSTDNTPWGNDVITDFDINQDILAISVANGDPDELVSSQTAEGALFTYAGDSSILLLGV
ncbi:MAG: LamG-like jellyroll fold domain-containing protein, partial [Kordiimonas sp.]